MSLARTVFTAALLVLATFRPEVAAADGHCRYTQQVPQGSYPVCEMPASQEQCEILESNEAVDALEFASGACPTTNVVGTCDKGSTQIVYYDGDPDLLKVGCGFQGGTWLNGYANP